VVSFNIRASVGIDQFMCGDEFFNGQETGNAHRLEDCGMSLNNTNRPSPAPSGRWMGGGKLILWTLRRHLKHTSSLKVVALALVGTVAGCCTCWLINEVGTCLVQANSDKF
jgi:hypothetical protein